MGNTQSSAIDISGIPATRLLAALHQRASYATNLAYAAYQTPMTEERAAIILNAARDHRLDFLDHVEGKVIGLTIDFTRPEPSFGNWLDPILYDAYNGNGAAGEVISWLRHDQILEPWFEQIGLSLQAVSPSQGTVLFPGL